MGKAEREREIHKAVLDYLLTVLPREAAATLIHVPNGEHRTLATGALLKRLGTKPGVEDLQFCHRGSLYAIEVKPEGQYQRPAQKARERDLHAAGCHYAVCRSTEDARETLAEWGIPTREVVPA